jgi:two-component system chemotaxis sensor kinase CheA
MEEAIQTFIEESNDLLQEMEDALLCIDPDTGNMVDEETINAIFCAAHTIKGSAGLFGFDSIVTFTHVVESVLDRVRDGEVILDSEMISLFLECRDHIGDLIDAVADGEATQNLDDERGVGLQQSLKRYLDEVEVDGSDAVSQFPVEGDISLETSGVRAIETDNWHISLRFSHDVLRDGMDPLSFIRYLETLGKIVHIVTLSDALPEVDDFDPETCYLGFEISFSSDAEKAEIEGVFEFVRDDCRLRILPPHSRIEQFIELIESLPEEEMRVGEILTHLVRNSMDHGIEAADIRVARGKPEYGTLRLNAYHDSGNIVIEVSDDGGGLDEERIKAKALERGLISREADINEQEIYRLILEAGFSTADAVSNLSGSGGAGQFKGR